MKEELTNLILNNFLPFQVVLPIFLAITLIFVKNAKSSSFLTQIYLLVGLVISLAIFLAINFSNHQYIIYLFGNFQPIIGIEYKISKVVTVILLLTSIVAYLGYSWGKVLSVPEVGLNKIYLFNILYLIFYSGLLGIIVTNDLFNIFIFTEIASIASYALIGLNRTSRSSPLTAFNYLIIGSVGTSLYVLGVGILYMLTGSLNIDIVAQKLQHITNPSAAMAVLLISLFILIKAGIFPFSAWVPKAYDDSPFAFNPLLVGMGSKVILFAFAKTLLIIYPSLAILKVSGFAFTLNIIAIVTIVIGAIIAISQTELKQLLAWSSVSYIGYIFLIIFEPNKELITATLALIIWHSLTKSGLFMVAGNIKYLLGTTNLNYFGELYKKSLFNIIAFILLSLSLIGIPGTLGFVVKWYLIVNLIHQGAIFSAIAIIISSAISVFYIWKVVEKIIFGKYIPNTFNKKEKLSLRTNLVVGLFMLLTIVLGVFGNYFINFLYNIVASTVSNF